jgi:phage terminase large subunit-like protein
VRIDDERRRAMNPAILAEDFPAFCATFGIDLYDWQREAFGEAVRREGGRFVHPLAGISAPRGNGKSYATGSVGMWRLMCGPPPQLLLSTALDFEGARVVPDHAKQIARRHPDLDAALEFKADSIVVPSTGSRWLIRSREHTASRGLHPNVVLYDEVGWARDDELFTSLLAAQASVADPLMLVVSTVGRRKTGPLWTIKRLAEEEATA